MIAAGNEVKLWPKEIAREKLNVIVLDDASDPTNGVKIAQKFVTQDKVDIIVGGGNMSGIAMAMVPMVDKAATPFISTEGSMQIVMPADGPSFGTAPSGKWMWISLFL